MTDKRFRVIHLGNAFDFVVKDIVENKTYGTFQGDGESMKKLCDDLDELHEENHYLKQQLEDCRDANTRCCNEYSFFHKEMMKAEKENKRIKQLINEALRTERTKIGQSVLKQLKEAIQ